MIFFLNPTDEIEVKNIILPLNPSKAIGPNSILTKIFKLLINDVSSQLTELFNVSFSRGVFPLILKTSKVIHAYKKDSTLKCSNYGPIPLLSNIGKVLERLMYNRLYNLLEMNSVIYYLQFGYAQKYSTSHTLIHLTDKIREQLDSRNFACVIFFDLQKVFDTVDHDIPIQKLNNYGIRGVANNKFSSYLQNRSEYVSINGFNSKLEHIQCGVSQGSILGPLLFLTYINDLNCTIRYCLVHHFVDDTNLLNYNNSVKRMNK